MMKRMIAAATRFLILASVLGTGALPAAPTVGTLAATPPGITAGTATPVTFTVPIDDASVLANGVNLLRTDASGKAIATAVVMRDDGTNGDAVAGDKVFTGRLSINQATTGALYYRVSAAFKGVLLRALSNVVTVTATPPTTIPLTLSGIAPLAAHIGETVTLVGQGFDVQGATVTVGGVAAAVTSRASQAVVFNVPAGAPFGPAQVRAANPGGASATVGLQVLEGVTLFADPAALAISALVDLPPVGVDATQIVDGIIMSRLDVRLSPTATVGQLNAALAAVGGGIVSMASGAYGFTIAVPQQTSVPALQALVDTLRAQPAIRFAKLARTLAVTDLPLPSPLSAPSIATVAHLLPSRFPAAWNVKRLILDDEGNCRVGTKVPLVVADTFGSVPSWFVADVPSFDFLEGAPNPGLRVNELNHGYTITFAAAAAAGGSALLGANPFNDCLDIKLVQTGGQSTQEIVLSIGAALTGLPASAKFVMTNSQAYPSDCVHFIDGVISGECMPPEDTSIENPIHRGWDALLWKEQTSSRWPDFLFSASGGNTAGYEGAEIYEGLRNMQFSSPAAIAHTYDPLFSFVSEPYYWNPSPSFPAFNSLVAPVDDATDLAQAVIASQLDSLFADNTLVVGGVEGVPSDADGLPDGAAILLQGVQPENLFTADFSGYAADVTAVGRNVGAGVLMCGFEGDIPCSGNSLTAPQVAGLASYLWLLSPDLREAPASNLAYTIGSNTGHNQLIDAYASILSLDAASEPTPSSAPIRLELLNVVGDESVFDETDVDQLLRVFYLIDANGDVTDVPVSPEQVDYGRYDLNGDGFTGGPGVDRFDLDRGGSAQFGYTRYDYVGRLILGKAQTFYENELTDAQILCYYAYSALYTGNPDARDEMLEGLCADPVVTVSPGSGRTVPNGTLAFGAAVAGSNDPRVTWSATCGSIDQDGLYTAPGQETTCKVRATSVKYPSLFGEATVIVQPESFMSFNWQGGMRVKITAITKPGAVCTVPFFNPFQTIRIETGSAGGQLVFNLGFFTLPLYAPATNLLSFTAKSTAGTAVGFPEGDDVLTITGTRDANGEYQIVSGNLKMYAGTALCDYNGSPTSDAIFREYQFRGENGVLINTYQP